MQMKSNSNFPVGGVPLDRSRYNPETFGKLAEAASEVPIEENKSPQEWKQIADRIEQGDQVSSEDLQAFQDLSKNARPERTRLRKALAASGYKDEKIKAQLLPFNVFDGPFNKLTEALRLGGARMAVQALASSSFGPLGVVTGYQAYANLAEAPLKELIGSIDEVQAGTAKHYHPGNKVEPFHQEQVWQKMNQMLDAGIQSAQDGKPLEINAQYYELTNPEFLSKLGANAEAGNKVRINVDPGRLLPYRGKSMVMDDYPDKMRAILQISQVKGDIAISTYPVVKKLEDPNDLMHRKGLRVGDEFFLSGMNANSGSGENIDAGWLIEGPAARQLVRNFARDVQDSKSASNDDIYGQKSIDSFMELDVSMGRRGLVSLMDALGGPAPLGTPLENPKNFAELSAYAQSRGFELGKLLDVPADSLETSVDQMLSGGEPIPLTAFAKEQVLELSGRAMDVARTPENLKRLEDISLPSGDPKGNTVVSLADMPSERETELLMAIQQAEKFIYVPAFVMTKPIAAALVAKNNEMKAQGKEFDVRVLADPGIYPDGGTPNEDGVKLLESGGIPVRWALLPRCGHHDRKIHAKELLTDKCEFFGSTNFSKKGLRENHEHSGVVHFDDDQEAQQRDQAKARFNDLWDNFSYECNSIQLATLWKKNYDGPDKEFQIEDARFGVIRKVLKGVEKFEEESGAWTEKQMESPQVQRLMAEMMLSGIDEMSAAHLAVRQTLGDEDYFKGLHGLSSYQELKRLAPRTYPPRQ
jgi:phosphatidylserine/phosphatidylglycerophosphate/cardiolipin synthase-like enzyme